MKNIFIMLSIIISTAILAEDMSRTESYKDSYKELNDGSAIYIGHCSTHQQYEKKYFKITKTLVDYFEINESVSDNEIKSLLKKIEPQLISAIIKTFEFDQLDGIRTADDLTFEKIFSSVYPNADLYRVNVGYGGGNGAFVVYNRIKTGKKIEYVLLSQVADGDVEFCDSSVWLKN